MLEFYYDFLDKYIDRIDFELIQMDTDSMYMALLSKSIDAIIRPELREEYDKEVKLSFCPHPNIMRELRGYLKQSFRVQE